MQSIWPSLVVFLAVLAAIPLAGWLLRRSQALGGQAGGALGIGGALAVGARERIVLVRVGRRWLLVGVTPQAISLLSDLGEAPEMPGMPEGAAQPGTSARFAELLRKSAGSRAH